MENASFDPVAFSMMAMHKAYGLPTKYSYNGKRR
jgi:hypothetical protein